MYTHQIFTILCATKITASTKLASTFTFEMDHRKYPCEISTWTVNTQVHHTSTDRILCIDLYDLYAEKETKWPNIQMVNLVTTCALRSWCLFEAEPALRLQSQTLDHSSHTWPLKQSCHNCHPVSFFFFFPLSSPPHRTSSRQKCDDDFAGGASGDCKCGLAQRRTRIVGGVETEVNEWPWQVGVVLSTMLTIITVPWWW